jgi:antitoxin (DNA-binding transcriptional repressor) of toxin-antitoxin stability system
VASSESTVLDECPVSGTARRLRAPGPGIRFVAESATSVHMARAVSIRELRNSTAAVDSELEAGERLTLTVNRRPVADILPHVEDRDPWVPASELLRILTEAPADAGLLDDLADVRGAELEAPRGLNGCSRIRRPWPAPGQGG